MSGPELQTERLVLRPFSARDVDAVCDYYATERSRFTGGPLKPGPAWRLAAALVGHWSIRGVGTWSFARKGEERAIGWAGAWRPAERPEAEICWTIFDAADTGKGYAAEAARAARACLYRAFGWTTAVSYIDPKNTPSIRVAERLGCAVDPNARTPDDVSCLVFRHPAPEAA